MPKSAVGPVALGAAKAETALAQTGNIFGGDGIVGQQTEHLRRGGEKRQENLPA